MIALTLSLALAPASFPGGSVNELHRFIGDLNGQASVTLAIADRRLRAAEFDPSDAAASMRTYRVSFGLTALPGTLRIAHEGHVPQNKFTDQSTEPELPFKTPEASMVKEGRVSFLTQGRERLDPVSLTRVPFTKPIRIHTFFRGMPLAVWARDLHEVDFLTMVARSMGGRLVLPQDSYDIRLDVPETRRRLKASVDRWRADLRPAVGDPLTPGLRALDLQITVLKGLLDEITPSGLERALETGGSHEFRLSLNSPAVRAYLESLAQHGRQDPVSRRFLLKTDLGELPWPESLDPQRPILGRLDDRLGARVRIPVRGQGPDAVLEFQFSRLQRPQP